MMVPNLTLRSSSGGGGVSSGALVRKRILTVDGGRPFVRITESMGQVDLGQILLDKAVAEYSGPLTLTREIVNFRICMIGGGGGGDITDGTRTAWGGWPGGVYIFEGRLSDIPIETYLFVGAGGTGAYVPLPENEEWDTGAAGDGGDTQFYLWDKTGNNHPTGGRGFAGGGYERSDEGQFRRWMDSQMYYDLRTPDPTRVDYGSNWGNNTGPGGGGPLIDGEWKFGGAAYMSDPLRTVGAGFSPGSNGFDGLDVFGAAGSGGTADVNGSGGHGGSPGGGGAGAIAPYVGGDGAAGQIHVELSIWEIA